MGKFAQLHPTNTKLCSMSERIEHQGRVEAVIDQLLRISIVPQAACVSCSAKGACTAADTEQKYIDVPQTNPPLAAGQQVLVYMQQSQGTRALWFGYLLPFVVLMGVLISASALLNNELVAGLLALGSLAPYYGILYLLRGQLARQFQFRVQPAGPSPLHLQPLDL